MLSAQEFTVGTLASAKPLSLMLPRTKSEHAALIAGTDQTPVAICLGPGTNFIRSNAVVIRARKA